MNRRGFLGRAIGGLLALLGLPLAALAAPKQVKIKGAKKLIYNGVEIDYVNLRYSLSAVLDGDSVACWLIEFTVHGLVDLRGVDLQRKLLAPRRDLCVTDLNGRVLFWSNSRLDIDNGPHPIQLDETALTTAKSLVTFSARTKVRQLTNHQTVD